MAESAKNTKEPPGDFFILGTMSNGRQFRPSDWAERLCGVMACIRPEGSGGGRNAHLQFSPYVTPTMVNDVKAVAVNAKLRQLEPLAYHFVVGFARDNDLQVIDACLMPEEADKP